MKHVKLLIPCILIILLVYWMHMESEDMPLFSDGAVNETSSLNDAANNQAVVGFSSVRDQSDRAANEGQYTQKEVDALWGLCGSELSRSFLSLIEAQPFLVSDFTDIQKAHYDDIYQRCHAWYEYVGQSHQHERYLAEMKNQSEKALAHLMRTDSKEIDETVELSKKVLKGEADLVTQDFAWFYLAKHDHALVKKIGDRIGTSNYAHVAAAHADYVKLFFCNREPVSCAAASSEMRVMCIYDAQLCGLSYPQYLATVRTHNEMADLYAMADAFAEIVVQGYP